MSKQQLDLEINLDEIRKLAEILTDVLIEENQINKEILVASVSEIQFTSVTEVRLDLISSCTLGITDPVGQIIDAISDLLESIASWIVSTIETWIEDNIVPLFDTVASTISSFITNNVIPLFDTLASSIYNFINTYVIPAISEIQDFINTNVIPLFDNVINSISSAIDTISTTVQSAISDVLDSLNNVAQSLSALINNVLSNISSAVTTITDTISSAIQNVITEISNVIPSVSDLINSAVSTISNLIAEVSAKVTSGIESLKQDLAVFQQSISDLISNLGASISTEISNVIVKIEELRYELNTLYVNIASLISDVSETIVSSISAVSEHIGVEISSLDTDIRSTREAILSVIASLDISVSKELADVRQYISEELAKITAYLETDIQQSRMEISQDIMVLANSLMGSIQNLVDYINKMVRQIDTGFGQLSLALQGFNNAILTGFGWLGGWLDVIINFFQTLYDMAVMVANFLSDPTKVFESLIKTLNMAFEGIWSFIQDAIKGLIGWLIGVINDFIVTIKDNLKSLTAIFSGIVGSLKGLGEASKQFVELIKGLIVGLWDALTLIVSPIAEGIKAVCERVIPTIFSPLTSFIRSENAKVLEELGQFGIMELFSEKYGKLIEHGLGFVARFLVSFAIGHVIVRTISASSKSLSHVLSQMRLRLEGHLRPLGIGGSIIAEFISNLPATFYELGKEIDNWFHELYRGLVYGFSIWITRPIIYQLNYHLRNVFPIRLPDENLLLEFARRRMMYEIEKDADGYIRKIVPYGIYRTVYEFVRYYMSYYGYSDEAIKWFLGYSIDTIIGIKDRFETIRNVPLTLVHSLPSVRELATMMVRDLFNRLDDFERILYTRGMIPDIAYLYYLLHFRYPPPERLWEFISRGISGLLWFKPSDELITLAEKEAKRIGAFKPETPITFNFKVSELFNALTWYMKWHDYARFSWLGKQHIGGDKNFTSDNWIIIDTLADIPTKIDQRWMVRWGLYEKLAESGVHIKTPVSEFTYKIVEDSKASEIFMDLTNFCRTLQATGLHPYYVPIVAVAETINAITDERTLMRTGFINLFREGVWGVKALEELMTKTIIASFKVAVFDFERRWGTKPDWHVKWINIPVMYLPAERKLLELRAMMDRIRIIIREASRDLARGYRENIVLTHDDFKKKLEKIIEPTNEILKKEYKAITGLDLPEELLLTYESEFFEAFLKAMDYYRDVYIVRRIRYWTSRWLGWIMYRVATGVVTKKDVDTLIAYVSKYAMLTQKEKEFLEKVLEAVSGIAVREYIPTPSQLATISEYIMLEEKLINNVLKARRVPEAWISIWKKYIKIRPIADDIRGLLTTYRRAILYVKVPKEITDKVMEYAKLIGYTERELDILKLRITLEEMILNSREYIPTPSMLASISEYIVIPENVIDAVLEIRRVPDVWKNLWKSYIEVRTVADDIRGLLTAYRRAVLYVKIPEDIEKKVMEYAKLINFTDRELDILHLRIALEQLIIESREYIPTPSQLATISEYIPKAREFIDDVFKARRIPEEWQSIWHEYITIRPIVDEVRKVLSSVERQYRYFMIDDTTFRDFLKTLKVYGYTDKEIDLIFERNYNERSERAWRELIGDVDKMTLLAEYSPTARDYALGLLYRMVDSLPIDDSEKQKLKAMWEQYIRLRPIMDEVRRYITELISDFVEGVITEEEFVSELEALKKFGLDDYEIMFYKALAGMRKARRLIRRLR